MAAGSKLSPLAQNLQQLCLIRIFVLILLLAVALYSALILHLPLYYGVIFTTSGIALIFTLAVLFRLRTNRPVSDIEMFAHLLLDVLVLSILIYNSGGAGNPFVSYYLVPLSISAATLPWRYTWSVAIISIACYSLMLFHYIPLDILAPHQHLSSFNPHLIGMWFTFAVSALLITYFVVKMAQTLRKREKILQEVYENNVRNEQIIGIATLAAGTAHKLGTPLATMAVLLTELKQQYGDNKELVHDINLLKGQLGICKNTLHELTETAQIHKDTGKKTLRPVNECISELVKKWSVIRPEAEYNCDIPENHYAPCIEIDACLEHAIQNLLNNAADANPKSIEIRLRWNRNGILLKIRDYGPGIPLENAEEIGNPFFSTKKGLGLGLFLSHSTVKRYGGSISLYNHDQGGTQAEVTLPIIRK